MTAGGRACLGCLRRAWLQAELAGHIELLRHGARSWEDLIALDDASLLGIAASGRRAALHDAWERFDDGAARADAVDAGLALVCRHTHDYPVRLGDLRAPPAVLHVAGLPAALGATSRAPSVAIVGARRATDYGREMARALGGGLAEAGVAVVSGMALGIDAAAHRGALDGGGITVAVLAGSAATAYPACHRLLHRDIREAGAIVSEAPPGVRARRWSFLARNRMVAALSDGVIVVEAGDRSGSLVTAGLAAGLGRRVGAVPGRATSPQSRGALALLRDGAALIREPADVLELLGGLATAPGRPQRVTSDPVLPGALGELLEAVGAGTDTVQSLVAAGWTSESTTTGLAELELLGRVVRAPGGRYTVVLPAGGQGSMFLSNPP